MGGAQSAGQTVDALAVPPLSTVPSSRLDRRWTVGTGMTDIVPVSLPALIRIPNVELMHTGTWELSTGPATFTTDDLSAAVAALGCPAVRRPILKLGHTDPRFDGEPCVGWVDNLAVAENGRTLVGDYAGLPAWLGEVIASAYPDRSIEGRWNYRCQMDHVHPFVVTDVALLGVTRPGIGTLESLHDVATLYGVVAKGGHTGTPVSLRVRGFMSNPARYVAAGVSAEDVTRAFYDSELGTGWDSWIEELQLDPLQLIYVRDSDNTRHRVPVIIGPDGVTFGDPIAVIIEYVDAAAPGPRSIIRFDRPDRTRASAPMDDTQLAGLRTALGLADDVDEPAVLAAVLARLEAPPPVVPPPPLPEGTVAIDQTQLAKLQTAAAAGLDARRQQEQERREGLVTAAVRDGRIPPARQDHWLAQLTADAGAADVLASLAPGLIPVGVEIGHAGGSPTDADDALYTRLFGAPAGGGS